MLIHIFIYTNMYTPLINNTMYADLDAYAVLCKHANIM